MTWLEKIIPSIGLLIGIIFVAVGATMLLSSVIKMATYIPNPGYYSCPMPVREPSPEGLVMEPTESDQVCKERMVKEERTRYFIDKKDMSINGGVLLVVGIVFWIFFARKRKEK